MQHGRRQRLIKICKKPTNMVSRYNRQELLPFIGAKGQEGLLESSAVIVGIGALGTVAAELLARAGIGRLTLIDRDIIEATDLQRQSLYSESDTGKPKANVAARRLGKINSEIEIAPVAVDIDWKNIGKVIGRPDIILDCTDNLETRLLINEYCLKKNIEWVHAAAIRESSQMMAFTNRKGWPCFACVFGKSKANETCDTAGVLGPATAVIASLQTATAIKMLVGAKVKPELMRLNVWQNTFLKINVEKNPKCQACSGKYEYLTGEKASKIISLCGKNTYQIKGKAVDLDKLKQRLKVEKITDLGVCITFRNLTVFKDGRALIKADSANKAKADYARYVGN